MFHPSAPEYLSLPEVAQCTWIEKLGFVNCSLGTTSPLESTGGSFRSHCFFHTRKFCCDVLRYDVPFSSPREVLNQPLCPRVVMENPVLLNIMVCQCNSTLADHRSLDDESWMDMMQCRLHEALNLASFASGSPRREVSYPGPVRPNRNPGPVRPNQYREKERRRMWIEANLHDFHVCSEVDVQMC